MFTLAHFKKFKNNIAIINNKNVNYSYANIIKEIKYFKNKINLSENKIAILVSNNFFSFIIIYLSCLIYRTKIIVINENSFKINHEKIIQDFKPNYIFSTIKISKSNSLKNKNDLKYKNYFIFESKKKNKVKINREIAILLTTTGSTGAPKFVCLSYENLLSNTRSIVNYLNINKSSSTITSLDPGYSYGLSIINSHLYMGSKIVMNRYSILEKNFWKLFKSNSIKFFYTVPLMCEILFKNKTFVGHFKNLFTLCCAGGYLDKKIKLNILSYLKNINFFIMYGQTEASPRISYVNLRKNSKKIESIGKPIKNGKLFFTSDQNQIINKKNPQEIFYTGKNVMLFYAKDVRSLNKKRSNKYIINTGDLGFKDKDNFFYITGRKNRITKINGVRVDLDQIEKDFKNQKIICINLENKIILCSKKNITRTIKYKISKIYNLGINNLFSYKLENIPLSTNNKIDYAKLTNTVKNDFK
jgi:long-chain acyl-CoA synthetase